MACPTVMHLAIELRKRVMSFEHIFQFLPVEKEEFKRTLSYSDTIEKSHLWLDILISFQHFKVP